MRSFPLCGVKVLQHDLSRPPVAATAAKKEQRICMYSGCIARVEFRGRAFYVFRRVYVVVSNLRRRESEQAAFDGCAVDLRDFCLGSVQ